MEGISIIQTNGRKSVCRAVKLINIETGEIRIFASHHAACRELGIHNWALKQTIKGVNNHAKGWKVERIDNLTKEDWDKMDKYTTSTHKICVICKKEYKSRYGKNKTTRCCSMACLKEYYKIYAKNGMPQKDNENKLLCYNCLEYKDEIEFYNQENIAFAAVRNNKSARCKLCQNLAGRNTRDKHKNELIFILRSRLTTAKSTSKSRGIYFDLQLSFKDLIEIYEIQKGVCPISNQILALNRDKTPYTISLDRKDSTKGYIKENVHLVCWAVNQMKNNFSLEELVRWCSFIINNNKTEILKIEN